MSPLKKKPLKKSALPVDKKNIFNISAQMAETEATVNSDWEISDKTEEILVRGRLKENSHFSKNELNPALFLQDIVDNDYIIPFITIPPSFYAPNNKSNLRNSKFVSQANSKPLRNNCIEELDQKPCCCNPLTVSESKKLRLVLDLRHVNSFIRKNKFRYENLTTLSEILSEGDHFTTFDLSSGYHHISKYIRSIERFLVLSGPLKTGLQNIFCFVFYHSVCHQHATFLPTFYAHLLSVGEVSALRLFFISMTVLQHLVVSILPKQE